MKKIKENKNQFYYSKVSLFNFRNCPVIYYCDYGFGLMPTFEDGILSEDQSNFFNNLFSLKSYIYEDMKVWKS